MKIFASTRTMTARASLVATATIAAATFVLIVRIKLCPMYRLDVFPQRRRIGVSFGATRSFADVRFLVRMRSVLMFRSVASVTESFAAPWILAGIWFLTGVRSEMSFEVFQSRVSFEATLKGTLVRFFSRVSSHMYDQHILSLKGFFFSGTFLPAANETFLVGVYMIVVDVFYEIILRRKLKTAVPPVTIRLDEITGFISKILTRTETLRMSWRGSSCGSVSGRRHGFPFDFGGGSSRRSIGFSRDRTSRRLRRFSAGFCILALRWYCGSVWAKCCRCGVRRHTWIQLRMR